MLLPLILSGGAGSRLWPVSRHSLPKPFIRPNDRESLLQRTWHRALRATTVVPELITVTHRDYLFMTRDDYQATGYPNPQTYLLEPFGRNTAPAIAAAALMAAERHGANTELLVLPADHLIEDVDGFARSVEAARSIARQGALVTFGIVPTRPETGYGYIEAGDELAPGCHRVAQFVEKPNAATADEYVASGRFLWNSGMFCFRADALLEALRRHAPEVFDTTLAAWKAGREDGDAFYLDPEAFACVPDISVDYAVMERHDNVAVVRATFDWNDIGSWNALGDLTPADERGNRSVGETITVDSENCFLQSESRVVAAVGVKNLIVVDTPDALLVADKAAAQDVKKVYVELKLANHTAYQLHKTVNRPWGTYTVLEEGPRFKLKRIVVKPGASLSLQMHHHRSEHWVVISGTAKVTNGERTFVVNTNESTFIPAQHKHRLENPGNDDLVIIEVQVGDYVGEDDIVRFEDVYGRA